MRQNQIQNQKNKGQNSLNSNKEEDSQNINFDNFQEIPCVSSMKVLFTEFQQVLKGLSIEKSASTQMMIDFKKLQFPKDYHCSSNYEVWGEQLKDIYNLKDNLNIYQTNKLIRSGISLNKPKPSNFLNPSQPTLTQIDGQRSKISQFLKLSNPNISQNNNNTEQQDLSSQNDFIASELKKRGRSVEFQPVKSMDMQKKYSFQSQIQQQKQKDLNINPPNLNLNFDKHNMSSSPQKSKLDQFSIYTGSLNENLPKNKQDSIISSNSNSNTTAKTGNLLDLKSMLTTNNNIQNQLQISNLSNFPKLAQNDQNPQNNNGMINVFSDLNNDFQFNPNSFNNMTEKNNDNNLNLNQNINTNNNNTKLNNLNMNGEGLNINKQKISPPKNQNQNSSPGMINIFGDQNNDFKFDPSAFQNMLNTNNSQNQMNNFMNPEKNLDNLQKIEDFSPNSENINTITNGPSQPQTNNNNSGIFLMKNQTQLLQEFEEVKEEEAELEQSFSRNQQNLRFSQMNGTSSRKHTGEIVQVPSKEFGGSGRIGVIKDETSADSQDNQQILLTDKKLLTTSNNSQEKKLNSNLNNNFLLYNEQQEELLQDFNNNNDKDKKNINIDNNNVLLSHNSPEVSQQQQQKLLQQYQDKNNLEAIKNNQLQENNQVKNNPEPLINSDQNQYQSQDQTQNQNQLQNENIQSPLDALIMNQNNSIQNDFDQSLSEIEQQADEQNGYKSASQQLLDDGTITILQEQMTKNQINKNQ